MTQDYDSKKRNWFAKFRDAFRGMKLGMRRQSSFFIHFFATVMVLAAGLILKCTRLHWILLCFCVTIVYVAEMFNSALETMAQAVEKKENPKIAEALNISSGAVLLAAIGAAVIGSVIFLNLMGEMMDWWD